MRPEILSKLPDVGTTIFTVMSQLAADTGAINLSQGFPSFDPPAVLLERFKFYLDNGANQYAPMPGVPALRRQVAAHTRRLHGRSVDADHEVSICTGATEGVFAAIQASVGPGDEVIVFDPAYDAYEPAVLLAGGIVRHVPLDASAGFAIDWPRFEATLGPKTRLVIVNFPHNPSGAVLDLEDIERLADLMGRSDALLLADEVYEHIVFDRRTHKSVLQHNALWPRCFVVSSFGKTFHATGWKVGYCIAPQALTTEFRKIRQFTTFAVNTPAQYALADFLDSDPQFADDLSAFYQAKRDLFVRELKNSRFRLAPSQGTFFQSVDYSAISNERDVDIARRWTREIGVACIPYSVFYAVPPRAEHRLRFCFAKDDATLREACARLRKL